MSFSSRFKVLKYVNEYIQTCVIYYITNCLGIFLNNTFQVLNALFITKDTKKIIMLG